MGWSHLIFGMVVRGVPFPLLLVLVVAPAATRLHLAEASPVDMPLPEQPQGTMVAAGTREKEKSPAAKSSDQSILSPENPNSAQPPSPPMAKMEAQVEAKAGTNKPPASSPLDAVNKFMDSKHRWRNTNDCNNQELDNGRKLLEELKLWPKNMQWIQNAPKPGANCLHAKAVYRSLGDKDGKQDTSTFTRELTSHWGLFTFTTTAQFARPIYA